MASVFKVKKPGGGYYKEWRFKYKDAAGKWRRGIGWRDKEQTQHHADDVEADARAIRSGEKEAPSAWLERRNKPMADVVTDYLAWGNACGGKNGKPWSKQNAALKKTYLEWWMKTLSLKILSDLRLSSVETALRDLALTGLAPKSVYMRFEALRSLCQWSIKRDFLRDNPLKAMPKMDTEPLEPHRELTDAEVARLFATCPAMHAIWYETALETGYRIKELRSLTVRDFDRFGPSLPLGADYTKNRKDSRQPITRELANKLENLAAGKEPIEPLLGLNTHAWEDINEDYARAGIHDNAEGMASWHSLRKVYVNNLIATGADIKTVMELSRHSAASMTLDVYAKGKEHLKRAATEKAAAKMRSAGAEACTTGVPKVVGGTISPDTATVNMVRATGVERVSTPDSPHAERRQSATFIGKPEHPADTHGQPADCRERAPCLTRVPRIDLRRMIDRWSAAGEDEHAALYQEASA